MKCRRCGIEMAIGSALRPRLVAGVPDLSDSQDMVGQTLVEAGADLVPVLKCLQCGHSVGLGPEDIGAPS